jgi:hypothetical protein
MWIGSTPFRRLRWDHGRGDGGSYIGREEVGGSVTHHLAFRNPNVDWQIWIRDGQQPLPLKYFASNLPGI